MFLVIMVKVTRGFILDVLIQTNDLGKKHCC